MQVNVNGVVSLGDNFNDFSAEPFPIDNDHLIALYWDDHVITPQQGDIFYRTSQDPFLINEVGKNISDAFSTSFTPSSLFIATWDRVQLLGLSSPGVSASMQ